MLEVPQRSPSCGTNVLAFATAGATQRFGSAPAVRLVHTKIDNRIVLHSMIRPGWWLWSPGRHICMLLSMGYNLRFMAFSSLYLIVIWTFLHYTCGCVIDVTILCALFCFQQVLGPLGPLGPYTLKSAQHGRSHKESSEFELTCLLLHLFPNLLRFLLIIGRLSKAQNWLALYIPPPPGVNVLEPSNFAPLELSRLISFH